MRVAFAATKRGGDSLGQNRTYFSEVFARGYLLIALFAIVFYLLCFLFARHYISISQGRILIGVYWTVSALHFVKKLFDGFPRFYRAIIDRMKLYSSTRRFFQWYVGCSVLILPFLCSVFLSYDSIVVAALNDCSAKTLLGAYGASLFLIFFLFTVLSNVVANLRGVRSSK
jgi:hypothetical protein